jgi:pimeloyl-ACP methyl ester carboxylesterase
MASFVLVHGAWHGSWCWKRVRRSLQQQGHEVFTPTLTGVGERSHLASPHVSLETHILDVVNLIRWEELSDVVLCGHSYGGFVITGVADRMADRIRSLVYLDAFAPEDGENLLQLLPEGQRDSMIEATNNAGGWRVPPISAEVFNVNANDSEWVNRQCTPQSISTFEQRISLTGAVRNIKNVTFVLATGARPESPIRPFQDRAKAKGWKTVTVDSGHDAMLDRPDDVARLLLAAL